MAQIYNFSEKHELAQQALEMGLSCNFQVRNHPLYHIIKAQSLKMRNEFKEARKSLELLMTLPNFDESKNNEANTFSPKLSERVTVYLELAKIESKLQNQEKATQLMQDAQKKFSGTHEEGRIVIANSG